MRASSRIKESKAKMMLDLRMNGPASGRKAGLRTQTSKLSLSLSLDNF